MKLILPNILLPCYLPFIVARGDIQITGERKWSTLLVIYDFCELQYWLEWQDMIMGAVVTQIFVGNQCFLIRFEETHPRTEDLVKINK